MTDAAIVLAYLVGSIPTGLWLGMALRGVDIRKHGSHNIGATNTMRVLGKKLGALALVGDAGKGLLAVLVIAPLSPWAYAPLACGLAAILGHTASIFLKFRGGKGVATSAGVFLALTPIPMLIGVVVFGTVVAATRMVSAGSMLAALVMTVVVYALPFAWSVYPTQALPEVWSLRIVVTLVAALVVFRHRSNLRRILRGEENKI
ncbi:MAG: glycerol-3-phosphate 1-O-acyltransferase PlsY [Candidatus Hydrogenedentes bacterium]|nr:glycerol-3-phosphate 1-O-acyltransferase PlsY [Candidatus Hydrogenedentota bacterium]